MNKWMNWILIYRLYQVDQPDLKAVHTQSKIHSHWAAYLGRAEPGPTAKINCLFSHRRISTIHTERGSTEHSSIVRCEIFQIIYKRDWSFAVSFCRNGTEWTYEGERDLPGWPFAMILLVYLNVFFQHFHTDIAIRYQENINLHQKFFFRWIEI